MNTQITKEKSFQKSLSKELHAYVKKNVQEYSIFKTKDKPLTSFGN